jgi:hypothetical protein
VVIQGDAGFRVALMILMHGWIEPTNNYIGREIVEQTTILFQDLSFCHYTICTKMICYMRNSAQILLTSVPPSLYIFC